MQDITPWLSSTLVSLVFIGMSVGYTRKRAQRHYAEGRKAAPSITSFKLLSKILFVLSMCFTLISYWVSSPLLPRLHQSITLQLSGALLVLTGYILLQQTFKALGNNYSPLFDAYLPEQLVTTGLYQKIRHPVYLYNLFVSFGLVLSSGLWWVLIFASIGFGFVLRAITLEEQYLTEHFPAYANYSENSYKLIPWVY